MAVATGEVALSIATPPAALSLLHEGRVRAVAVGGPSRLKQFADVPTMGEHGVSDDPLIPNYFALAAPSKTPTATIQTLNAAIARAVAAPELLEKLEANGLVASPSSPQAMVDSVKSDIARFGELSLRPTDLRSPGAADPNALAGLMPRFLASVRTKAPKP